MQTEKRNRRTTLMVASAGVLAVALATSPVSAHGGGGAMGGMSGLHGNFGGQSSAHISTSGLANTNGPSATTRTFGTARADLRRHNLAVDTSDSTTTSLAPNGGNSSSHISASGSLNTNGPDATTRTFGRNRAKARETLRDARHSAKPDGDNDGDDMPQ